MRISVVIPTLNRVKCLENLLESILKQKLRPFEVIIVDQSDNRLVFDFFNNMKHKFKINEIKLLYARQTLKSSAVARNFGIFIAGGDWISFLDDDIALSEDYYYELLRYVEKNSKANLLSGNITNLKPTGTLKAKIADLFKACFLLDRQSNENGYIYSSFFGNLPAGFSEVKKCEWISSSNAFARASILKKFYFDDKLISYSCSEDKDLSYRIYKAFPDSLYAVPTAKLEHLEVTDGRLPPLKLCYMRTVYSYYFFFKNIEQTLLNKLLFIWSRIGLLLSYSVPRFKLLPVSNFEFKLFKQMSSEIFALKHLDEIKRQKLDFFNDWFNKQT